MARDAPADRPGPGIYYLGDPTGAMLAVLRARAVEKGGVSTPT